MSEKGDPNQVAAETSDRGIGHASDDSGGQREDRSDGKSGSESSPSEGAVADGVRSHRAAERAKPAGRGLAVLALILALLSLAGVVWLYLQGLEESESATRQESSAIPELQAEISSLREQAAAADAARQRIQTDLSDSSREEAERLEAIEGAQARIRERLTELASDQADNDQLGSALARQGDLVETLERRVGEIDDGLADLGADLSGIESRLGGLADAMQEQQGVRREVDRDLALKLDLLEIAALMAIGQARIELIGDKGAALAAYEQADRQLAAVSDRRLGQAADRLAEEITLIEAWTEPDWSRFGARLAQLEGNVVDWPLRPETGATTIYAAEAGDEEATGWLSTMRQSLGQLVTVERVDDLSLDAATVVAIREQLQLHLAAAGLAVQRRDDDMLRLRLEHVMAILDEFFQVDSEPLAAVRAELDQMSEVEVPLPPEELGQAAAALDRVIDSL